MLGISRVSAKPVKTRPIDIGPWVHGVVTAVEPGALSLSELSDCVNLYTSPFGALSLLPATRQVTSSAFSGRIRGMYPASDGYLYVCAENYVYKVDTSTWTKTQIGQIDTTSGDVRFLEYGDRIWILDGSWVKQIKDGTVKIGYDCGTGARGRMVDQLTTDLSAYLEIKGSVTRAAAKVRTATWPSYLGTIPIVRIRAVLSAVGTVTGAIYACVWTTGGTELGRQKLTDANILPTTGSAIYDAVFSPDGQEGLSPDQEIYVGVEWSPGGSTTNYIRLHGAPTSGESNGYTYSNGTWVASPDPIKPAVSICPSLPPKLGMATIWLGRPWGCGDPDNPGYLWFGNTSMLDWSSPLGGGWVAIGDSSTRGFAVQAIAAWYGDLYCFGGEEHPYIVRLKGTTIESISQSILYTAYYVGSPDCLSRYGDDIVFSNGYRVWTFSTVREYGDVKSSDIASPISDELARHKIRLVHDSHDLGLSIGVREGSSRIAVRSALAATSSPNNPSAVRFPWSWWQIYRHDFLDVQKWRWVEYAQDVWMLLPAEGLSTYLEAKPDAVVADELDLVEMSSIDDLSIGSWCWESNQASNYHYTVFAKLTKPPESHSMVRACMIPVKIAERGGTIYLAGSDGHIYETYPGILDMGEIQRYPRLRTALVSVPGSQIVIRACRPYVWSSAGGSIRIGWYRGHHLAAPVHQIDLAVRDSLIVGEAQIPVGGATYSVSSGRRDPMARRLSIPCESFAVSLVVMSAGEDLSVKGIQVDVQPLMY